MKSYLKKFTTLFVGVALAQLIGFLLLPILSRLYSPEQFGELSLFVSITGIIAIVSTLKLNEAVMLAKDKKEIYRVLGAIMFFSFALLIFLLAITLSTSILIITEIISVKLSIAVLLLLPFNIIGLALYNTNTLYLTKESLYNKASLSNINRALGLNIGQLVFSATNVFNGLLLGNVVGNMMGSYYTIKARKKYTKYINWKNFKFIIKNYSHFPKYNLPQAILNNTSSVLPNIMLIIPFGAGNVGLYYMVLKLLNLPTTLVSNIVTNLFYQDASNRFNEGKKISSYYFKTVLLLFSIIIIPAILLVKIGPSVIPTILGNEWMDAAELIPWVTIWTASMFIYTPATKVVIIQTWQNYILYYNLTVFLIRVGILLYGISSLNFFDTIIQLCIFNTVSNLSLVIGVGAFLFRKEQNYDRYNHFS